MMEMEPDLNMSATTTAAASECPPDYYAYFLTLLCIDFVVLGVAGSFGVAMFLQWIQRVHRSVLQREEDDEEFDGPALKAKLNPYTTTPPQQPKLYRELNITVKHLCESKGWQLLEDSPTSPELVQAQLEMIAGVSSAAFEAHAVAKLLTSMDDAYLDTIMMLSQLSECRTNPSMKLFLETWDTKDRVYLHQLVGETFYRISLSKNGQLN